MTFEQRFRAVEGNEFPAVAGPTSAGLGARVTALWKGSLLKLTGLAVDLSAAPRFFGDVLDDWHLRDPP